MPRSSLDILHDDIHFTFTQQCQPLTEILGFGNRFYVHKKETVSLKCVSQGFELSFGKRPSHLTLQCQRLTEKIGFCD